MSPEQVRGGTPHPSWDIWALAVVTYEMLTGRLPFEAATGLRSCRAAAAESWIHLADPQPELPPGMDSVFEGAFSHDPAKRPAGALVFLNSFEHVVDGYQ